MFNNSDRRIFLDYAAATPVSDRARHAYIDALQYFANPQALHTEGLAAARARDDARSAIARVLGVKSAELLFTSGGTEANNLGLAGYLYALEEQGVAMENCHIIIGAIEHPSVRNLFARFMQQGLTISFVSPNEHGEIKPEAVKEVLQENTVLVSVALVNSEIGTVQPIHAIGKMLKETQPRVGAIELEKTMLHIDASQGLYQSLVPQGLGADIMSFNSGKMFGPRGVGALYVRRGVTIASVLQGGSQESGLRPGTENVALAAGFAAAFEEAAELRASEHAHLAEVRTQLLDALRAEIPGIVVNGDAKNQSPHILNISIPNIDAEYVAMYLDQRGIALSTKSACLERADSDVSHVVAALGGESWRAKNTLRFSFGRDTTIDDIPSIVTKVRDAVEKYQSFS